jgi:hypothetical protein
VRVAITAEQLDDCRHFKEAEHLSMLRALAKAKRIAGA